MYRRLYLLVVPTIFLLFIASTLYVERENLSVYPRPTFARKQDDDQQIHKTHPNNPSIDPEPIPDGIVLPSANISVYLDAILKRKETDLPSLACPKFNHGRYKSLQIKRRKDSSFVPYFFALDLRQSLPLLPQLIGNIIEAVQFLGSANCVISIVEGNSNDGTTDVLQALGVELKALGVDYRLQFSTLDPSQDDRIGRLASLRNLALNHLAEDHKRFTGETTVIFANDVALCADDLLELVLQKKNLGADMTCAMDWTYAGADPTFYDVWVARGITGDSFFLIPPDGNWNSAWNIFWNDQESQSRLHSHQPFQVFSCWNGATAFTAQAILQGVTFRKPKGSECIQGEPQLFCKDLWANGFGKIAVIPTVNLEYSISNGKRIKEAKGFTSANVAAKEDAVNKIQWQSNPPEKVKCMTPYDNQIWQPWNESLNNTKPA